MPDAGPPGPSRAKLSAGTKVAKSGSSADAGSDNKKRFEVKKVYHIYLEQGYDLLINHSGTLWPSGPGTSLWITAPFAGTTSWISVCSPHI